MARPKAGATTKASQIRDAISANPSASTKEIVEMLGKQGVTVSPNHVYIIKSKARGRRRRAKREMVAQTIRNTAMPHPAEAVQRVKNLALELGGLKNLKRLVDVLAE